MVLFIGSKWFCLQDEFLSVLTIIVSPTVNFRNLSRPVTMTRVNRCCPFQGVCLPWILCCYFPSFENGIEKVKYKHQLHGKYHHGNRRYESVEISKLIE